MGFVSTKNSMKKTLAYIILSAFSLAGQAQGNSPQDQFGKFVQWDRHSLVIDGRRVVPVMGEIHYSRLPENEWGDEVRKMREGGVTIIANYVFWNHVEEQQGIFDWSNRRSLRRFLEICKAEGMPVCLRIGPFCHGEARCGGIPDWVVQSGCKLRSEDPKFLGYVEALYRQIFTQVQGLQWKDGGPVLACQFDNEYGGNGSYLMELKAMAQRIGFDLPFYTRTGWPALRTPTPFGEMIPLYGDYADGFWDRSTKEGAGNYWKAFHFTSSPTSGAVGSEQLDYSKKSQPSILSSQLVYPYFTCELGGGMMTSYHRRCYLYPEDAYAMALVKLGSGSNLLGYYMYHGGTNPDGHLTYLNECQKTPATNYNDLPVKTYDFQAPLGEFGQKNPHYYMLRKLHLFMHDWGEVLAPMEAVFPCADKTPYQYDDSYLRWSYRCNMSSTENGRVATFIFINNYERFANLTTKKNVQLEANGVILPKLTIPAGTMCIFPVNIDGINYATAQLIAKRDGKIYLEQIKGIPTTLAIGDKVLKNLKAKGPDVPVYKNYYLITSEQAERLFLDNGQQTTDNGQQPITFVKIKGTGPLRPITIGVQKAAEEPVDADFDNAAVYAIQLPKDSMVFTLHSSLLKINYRGDVARLYANGKIVADNFYNGRPFLFGLWRLPKDAKELELRILPLQQDMPVYFPREADTTPGEEVKGISIEPLNS